MIQAHKAPREIPVQLEPLGRRGLKAIKATPDPRVPPEPTEKMAFQLHTHGLEQF